MKTLILFVLLLFGSMCMAQNGKYIGTVKINALPPGQSVNFNIQSGNYSTAFRIDASKGEMFVNNQTAIEAYADWKYTLVVRVRYSTKVNGVTTILADTMRTIRILNMVNNKYIGTMVAVDDDNIPIPKQRITFYIVSGNYSTAFKIDGTTGKLTIANVNSIVNWLKTNDRYVLNIRARDSGKPYAEGFGTATILLFGNVQRQDVFNCRQP